VVGGWRELGAVLGQIGNGLEEDKESRDRREIVAVFIDR
jgi:hypothetical protein